MPDNSEQPPISSSPKRPTLMVPTAPITSGEEILLEAGKIDPASLKGMPPSPQGSSQSGMANDMAHTSHLPSPSSPWGNQNCQCPTLACLPQGPPQHITWQCSVPPGGLNNAMSHILTLQASLDAQWWRLMSDIETELHQNEAKATKAIKILKACYTGTIHEAEAMYAMAIREVETNCSTSIMEAEGGHLTAVRDRSYMCSTCPWLTTGTWGSHKYPGKWGHQGGWVGSPIFPVGLWRRPSGPAPQSP